jgi:hypothetical protein
MAVIVKIDKTDPNGAAVLRAAGQIREGLAVLRALDGLRANAIGVSSSEFASVFGVTAQPQALSDRWGALLDALYNASNANYEEFALLRDFIEATTSS